MNKDKIMSAHLDLRLTNNSTVKINDRMKVMRLQAKKLANDFLWSHNNIHPHFSRHLYLFDALVAHL